MKLKKHVVVELIRHLTAVPEILFVVVILMEFTPTVMHQVTKNVGMVFMPNFVNSMRNITMLSEQVLMMIIV